MNNKLKYGAVLALASFSFAACDTDVEHEVPAVEAPAVVYTFPGAGNTGVRTGELTIKIAYDKHVFFATKDLDKLTLEGGEIIGAEVYGTSDTLSVKVKCPYRAQTYTLSVPEGAVSGPNRMPAPAFSLDFTTIALDSVPVNASATAPAKKLYAYLLENFGKKTISAMMADVDWNTRESEHVYQWTGKYPAINCFDYIHLYASGSWIDYTDITPVSDWWNAGGWVAAMWHWNVPVEEGSDEYAFYRENTKFDADKALTEGTWENTVFKNDLEKAAGCLKLLQDAGIPVIWRPFHEAAGGWFWWGKNAASFKNMWIYMFDYFRQQGVNNLIWVWTTEQDDADWYPGDAYVDIVGRDIYKRSAAECAAQYTAIAAGYGHKMVALSECGYTGEDPSAGILGEISAQWENGARWMWFMPWYDSALGADNEPGEKWWKDAMSRDFVISREELPSIK